MENTNTAQGKTRYSAEELQEFKELILKKMEEAKRNLDLLNQAVAGGENNDSETAHRLMTIDDGQEVLAKEENSKLAARQMRFIKDLEAALIRIENQTYGICRITGKLIPKERLMIVPHATTTVEGKNMQNAQKKNQNTPKPIL